MWLVDYEFSSLPCANILIKLFEFCTIATVLCYIMWSTKTHAFHNSILLFYVKITYNNISEHINKELLNCDKHFSIQQIFNTLCGDSLSGLHFLQVCGAGGKPHKICRLQLSHWLRLPIVPLFAAGQPRIWGVHSANMPLPHSHFATNKIRQPHVIYHNRSRFFWHILGVFRQ